MYFRVKYATKATLAAYTEVLLEGLSGRRRFDSTDQIELRFHALLTENGTQQQTKWMRVYSNDHNH
jgi:hypothetical protein